jgi:hypothetical protein
MKQIQSGDGANFMKEIADTSEGTMTGKKWKNVSWKESHLLLETNKNQRGLLLLNQLFQNYKICHRTGIFKTNMTGSENTSWDSWEIYQFLASSYSRRKYKVY